MCVVPKWRNWQTRVVQVHVLARVWGFESLLRHQSFRINNLENVLLSVTTFGSHWKRLEANALTKPEYYHVVAQCYFPPLSESERQELAEMSRTLNPAEFSVLPHAAQ